LFTSEKEKEKPKGLEDADVWGDDADDVSTLFF
jgi:hypothetical protein